MDSGWSTRTAVLAAAAIQLATGCGDREPGTGSGRSRVSSVADLAPEPESDGDGGAPAEVHEEPMPPGPPLFGEDVRSLRLRRSITVRAAPVEEADKLGTVARDTQVGWKSAVQGPGCESRWIEIEPQGWVCESYLEPSPRQPAGVELPKLGPGELVPGRYGKVVGERALAVTVEEGRIVSSRSVKGSTTVVYRGELMIAPQSLPELPPETPPVGDGGVARGPVRASGRYWAIGGGEYVPASAIQEHQPSTFSGARLQDDTGRDLPIGFAISSGRPGDWVPVYSSPEASERKRRLAPRTLVEPLETRSGADGAPIAYRLGDDQWIRAADVRMADRTSPPPTTGSLERWFDIDLDKQILVAYEGELPVYVTLVSSGTNKNPTETGIYRVWIKFAETDMSGRMGESDAYSVAQVPWTQFYAVDFALHTSFWHDRFGQKRSHGCVNLSPRDARFLYFWSDPQVPRGWSMANGNLTVPGSLVRVRSAADPEPEFRGYATEVYQQRLGKKSVSR